MRPKKSLFTKQIPSIALFLSATVFIFMFVFSFANAESNEPTATTETVLLEETGTLTPGQSAPLSYPHYPLPGASNDANFSITITGTNAAADLIINGTGWGSVTNGEVIWGNTTLIPSTNNSFRITNNSGATLQYAFKLVTIATVPTPSGDYSWAGKAAPSGENSEIELKFPHNGLYTFDFSVSNGGRYDFVLGSNDIQSTVTGNYSTTLFVEAGVQTLQIIQDPSGVTLTTWQVDISDAGETSDSLPYAKENEAIAEEWLPINLSTAAEVNMKIFADGTADDQLTVTIDNADPQLLSTDEAVISVIAGETTWTTFDLPAGTSSIHLQANNDDMDYAFEIMELPSADDSFVGYADAAGQNSTIRMVFDTAGLYDFDFGSNGRYQFLLNNGDSYIQKTVENSSSVTYYVPAGTHNLTIDQDTAANADWDVGISFNAASDNSLPYAKDGGDIGGASNDFLEEWLPISLSEAATVNMAISADGAIADDFSVEVYKNGSNIADYTLTQVLGSEDQWSNFTLSAGINRLKIVGNNTGNPLSYDLELTSMPTNGTLAWDGNVLDNGLNASVIVDFPADGLYHFNIESTVGFANLILDDNVTVQALSPTASPPDLKNSYDIEVTAGTHELFVMQDNSYPNTSWTASIAPTTAGAQFFEFTGTLSNGESVTPIYPGNMDFNFSLTVSDPGSNVTLDITDGSSGTVWSGTALTGETLWGTGTLSGENELKLTNNGPNNVDVVLTLYHIPDAGTSWDGFADGNGLNSEIRVNFPTDGLYTFDLNADSGRYQFLVDSEYIQKTVEAGSSSVAYFVQAGVHSLMVVQDNAVDTDWNLDISDVGAGHNTLPYMKSGGDIGGVANDFDTEWLPINLSAATAVNIATTITGTPGDSVVLNVRNAASSIIKSLTINADETTWMTLELPVGTSRLELVASGNTGTAEYEVLVTTIPTATNYSWDGNSIDSGANSHIRLSFPQSGLYTFDYAVDSGNGRYQFLVNEDFLQKTVEDDGSVVYYVPAGTQDLTIDQDSTLGADWSLTISGPGAANDTLPYTKNGGEIGGTGNDFTQEWLPVYVGTETMVNAVISIDGDSGDAVSLEVWDTVTRTETIEMVYGTESVWATFTLPAGGRLLLTAEGNTTPVDYDIEIIAIPTPTFSWDGTSLAANSLNSTIEMDIQASGVYRVQGVTSEGFTAITIDPTPVVNSPTSANSQINLQVHLDAGLHTFAVMQGTTGDGYITSSWVYTVTLISADAPKINTVTPATVLSGQETTITVDGSTFLNGAKVWLRGETDYELTTTYVSGLQLTAVVPTNVDIDLYDVQVINPDTQSDTLADGLEVIYNTIFLPMIIKN